MVYGICKLSVVPVRTEPSDKSEIGTQLLFGEIYSIQDQTEDGKWVKIEQTHDQYTGWIDTKQHTEVSQGYYQEYIQGTHAVCIDLTAFLTNQGVQYPILLGSVLPFYTNGKIRLESESLTYKGNYRLASKQEHQVEWKKAAYSYLKAPYLWGGRSPFGIDCSGFVQVVFRVSGYSLPRDSWQQAMQGTEIQTIEQAMPGDLAFFDNTAGRIVHVGIIYEKGKIIHASGEVRIDKIDEQGIWKDEIQAYSHKLKIIKRVI